MNAEWIYGVHPSSRRFERRGEVLWRATIRADL